MSLLTPQERDTCLRIARLDGLPGQRAAALLALDSGETRSQAGEKAGLTAGQVGYFLARFRKQRLGAFPPDLLFTLDQTESGPDVSPAKPKISPVTSADTPTLATSHPKGKKTKKAAKKKRKGKRKPKGKERKKSAKKRSKKPKGNKKKTKSKKTRKKK